MSISKRIIESKNGTSLSERLNISSKLYGYIINIDNRKNDLEYLKLIPTQIVASNESFFKETISSLIDYNQIYLENSKDLVKRSNIKPDLIDVLNVKKQNISLGDIIAYSLKYSSFDVIYSNLTSIASVDVFSAYDNAPFSIVEYIDLTDGILDDVKIDRSRIFQNLKDAYELRHVVCHDFLNSTIKQNFSFKKIKEYLIDCFLMQELTTIVLSEQIYLPNSKVDYHKEIESKNEIIEQLYKRLEAEFFEDVQFERLRVNKNLFAQFIEQDSVCFGHGFRDLSHKELPFDILIHEHKLKLLDMRINFIEKYFEDKM
ncbi:MAG: hypothetical protein ACFHU9_03660 [Fluviicola sp.]